MILSADEIVRRIAERGPDVQFQEDLCNYCGVDHKTPVEKHREDCLWRHAVYRDVSTHVIKIPKERARALLALIRNFTTEENESFVRELYDNPDREDNT